MSTPVFQRSPIHTAIGAALFLTAAWAQAQSGFTVNTLTGMIGGSSTESLDNSDVAHGNLSRFSVSGYLVSSIGGPSNGTSPRSAKWSASTAATVSASNRFPLSTYMSTQAVSDNGVWQGLWSTYDSTTKRANGTSITNAPSVNRNLGSYRYSATIRDINNQGEMVGTQYEQSSYRPYYWASNQGVRLDCGDCHSAVPLTINNRGEIGGWIRTRNNPAGIFATVPAIWRNGSVAWTGDPQVLGPYAFGVAMNDAGTLVVQAPGTKRSFTVSASGTVLPLSPQASTVWANDINAAGVIVGSVDGKAVMWVNGQQIDLAAHLASKGVSQANTWLWLDIYDINDNGSMLVTYRLPNDPANTTRKARLTAKP